MNKRSLQLGQHEVTKSWGREKRIHKEQESLSRGAKAKGEWGTHTASRERFTSVDGTPNLGAVAHGYYWKGVVLRCGRNT